MVLLSLWIFHAFAQDEADSQAKEFHYLNDALKYEYSFDRGEEMIVIAIIGVDVHEKPDLNSPKLPIPYKGKPVIAEDMNGDWVLITYKIPISSKEYKGWISGAALKPASMTEKVAHEQNPMGMLWSMLLGDVIALAIFLGILWVVKMWLGKGCVMMILKMMLFGVIVFMIISVIIKQWEGLAGFFVLLLGNFYLIWLFGRGNGEKRGTPPS